MTFLPFQRLLLLEIFFFHSLSNGGGHWMDKGRTHFIKLPSITQGIFYNGCCSLYREKAERGFRRDASDDDENG